MRLPILLLFGLTGLACLAGLLGPGAPAMAQTTGQNPAIFTCIDSRGRTITADRPIPECGDRTQRELTGSGLVKRQMAPVPTANEQILLDEKNRLAAETRAREYEERRRDRALLLRYPAQAQHDQERSAALAQVDEVIGAIGKRSTELADQRRAIDNELEFYTKDPTKIPGSLKRKLQEHTASIAAQQKFVAEQELEKKRVNQRFDGELVRLRQLWAQAGPAAMPSAGGARIGKN